MSLEPTTTQISAIQNGSPEAFEEFVREYRREFYFTAYRFLSDRDLAMDAVQETFMKILKGAKKFSGHSSFRAWTFQILRNTCVDLHRAQKSLFPIEAANERSTGALSPSQILINRERDEILWQAIRTLSETLRETLLLRVFHEMKHEEIADILKIPVGTVRSRLALARETLRQKLEKVL